MNGYLLFKVIELLGGVGLKGEAGEVDHFSTPE